MEETHGPPFDAERGPVLRRARLVVSYDGTAYRGFQVQKNGITIQQAMEEALGRLLGETVRLRAAGRTDAGVHARGQVVDFAHSGKRLPGEIVRGGNALLPPDIRILGAEDVPLSFDARRHAREKEYRYFLAPGPVASPFLSRYAWHVERPLDLDAMRGAAARVVGTHDFSSFRGQGCTARTAVRTVHRAEIVPFREGASPPLPPPGPPGPGGDLWGIVVAGDGFLRHMVRAIAGTLVEIGRGKRPPEAMEEILARRDRSAAGPTAPPRGLFLWEVRYGGGAAPDAEPPPGG